jgi:hypothetical protein
VDFHPPFPSVRRGPVGSLSPAVAPWGGSPGRGMTFRAPVATHPSVKMHCGLNFSFKALMRFSGFQLFIRFLKSKLLAHTAFCFFFFWLKEMFYMANNVFTFIDSVFLLTTLLFFSLIFT